MQKRTEQVQTRLRHSSEGRPSTVTTSDKKKPNEKHFFMDRPLQIFAFLKCGGFWHQRKKLTFLW